MIVFSMFQGSEQSRRESCVVLVNVVLRKIRGVGEVAIGVFVEVGGDKGSRKGRFCCEVVEIWLSY